MNEIFNPGFIQNLQIFFVAILIYAVVYSLLKKLSILGENSKIDSLIALLAAIIVSFTGVASYSITYAINWFVIIFFILFLMLLIFMFLGVKMDTVTEVTKGNAKYILWFFGIVFGLLIVKSFFALNNAYDINNPQEDKYAVDTSFNTGVDDMTNEDGATTWQRLKSSVNPDLFSAVLFLIGIGIFVMIIGR